MSRKRDPGPWNDRSEAAITLPFTPESVRQALQWGLALNAPHTHEDIAEWCRRFWIEYLDEDAPKEIERVLPVLADVDAQWDMFLANTYTLEDLKVLDFSRVRLPEEWFADWLRAIDA